MVTPYSFVIPVLDEAGRLAPLLRTLRRAFPAAELIVVDGGSRDGCVAEALGVADLVLLGERGRAAQMNLGAAVARGEWLCFLHADTVPEFRAEAFACTLSAGREWGFCRVRLSGRAPLLRLVEASMNLRSRCSRVATGDQLLFLRRGVFERCGGYAPIPLMEDIELSKRLRRLGPPAGGQLRVCSSSRRWEQRGLLRTILLMWRLRFLYACGVTPATLWTRYYGR